MDIRLGCSRLPPRSSAPPLLATPHRSGPVSAAGHHQVRRRSQLVASGKSYRGVLHRHDDPLDILLTPSFPVSSPLYPSNFHSHSHYRPILRLFNRPIHRSPPPLAPAATTSDIATPRSAPSRAAPAAPERLDGVGRGVGVVVQFVWGTSGGAGRCGERSAAAKPGAGDWGKRSRQYRHRHRHGYRFRFRHD